MWPTPPGHIGAADGRLNGPELHRGPRLCVSAGLFSSPEVPITDYQTKEETEQGLSGLVRVWGNAGDVKQGRILYFCYLRTAYFTKKTARKMNFKGNSGAQGDS